MKTNTYQWILYTIVIVITTTIGIQFYWNYKNYLSAEQELVKDVQIILDKSVDDYYANLAKETTLGFSLNEENQEDIFDENSQFNRVLNSIEEDGKRFTNLDVLENDSIEGVTLFKGRAVDSMMNDYNKKNKPIPLEDFKGKVKEFKDENPDIETSDLKILTSKITVSITNDTLDLRLLDTIFSKELKRKNISFNYKINYLKKDKYDSITLNASTGNLSEIIESKTLQTYSSSPFLPMKSELNIVFTNPALNVFGRIIGGILISLLLVLAVIGCLFYLLYIIKNQKELSEVKNDLISNITHEFKTPIATIGVALEGIRNFNEVDDKEKTEKYLNISTNHLNKLNIMVEKLLETATIDSENLELNEENINLVELLETMINSLKVQHTDKNIISNFDINELYVNVDVFHFENAINNILDNAVKYGGNTITASLESDKGVLELTISDDGGNLGKAHQYKIFEKFYRVPKGNTHDVKGFGIGLHYTKSIIEKHNGTIKVDLNKGLTTFKIKLPHV